MYVSIYVYWVYATFYEDISLYLYQIYEMLNVKIIAIFSLLTFKYFMKQVIGELSMTENLIALPKSTDYIKGTSYITFYRGLTFSCSLCWFGKQESATGPLTGKARCTSGNGKKVHCDRIIGDN